MLRLPRDLVGRLEVTELEGEVEPVLGVGGDGEGLLLEPLEGDRDGDFE